MANMFDDPSEASAAPGNMFDDDTSSNPFGFPQRPAPPPPPPPGDFMAGARTALGQTPALIKGAVGLSAATLENLFGSGGMATGVKNWALDGFQRDMAEVAKLQQENHDVTVAWAKAKEGDWGAMVDFIQYAAGYGAAQLAESALAMLAGSVVGGALGGAAAPATAAAGAAAGVVKKGLVKSWVEGWLTNAVAKRVAESGGKLTTKEAIKQLGAKWGGTQALMGWATIQETGAIYPEAVEQIEGVEGREMNGYDIARVWGFGIAAGLLEGGADKLQLDAILGRNKYLKAAFGKLGAMKRTAIGGGIGLIVEPGTELGQTYLEQLGAQKDPFSDEAKHEYINAMAMAAVPGLGVGMVGGAMSRQRPASPPAPTGELSAGEIYNEIGRAGSVDEAIMVAGALTETGLPMTEGQLLSDRALMVKTAEEMQTVLRDRDWNAIQGAQAAQAGAEVSVASDARERRLGAVEEAQRGAGQDQMLGARSEQQLDLELAAANAAGMNEPAPQTAMGLAMERELGRLSARLMEGNPTQLRTTQLEMLAAKAPDPAVRQRAIETVSARRNADAATLAEAQSTEANRSALEQTNAPNDMPFSRPRELAASQPMQAPTVTGAVAPAPTVTGAVAPGPENDAAAVQRLNGALAAESQRAGQTASPDWQTVDVAALPVDDTPMPGSPVNAMARSQESVRLAQGFAGLFGKRMVPIRNLNAREGDFMGGTVISDDGERVFVNVDSPDASPIVIAGHELGHLMEQDAPDLAANVRRAIGLEGKQELTAEHPLVGFYRYYEGGANLTDEQVVAELGKADVLERMKREITSDFLGNRAGEYKTLQTVFKAVAGSEDTGLIYKVADYIVKFIDSILRRLKTQKFEVSDALVAKLVKDLEGAKQVARDAMAEYAKRQGLTKMQAEAAMREALVSKAKAAAQPKPRLDKNRIPILSKQRTEWKKGPMGLGATVNGERVLVRRVVMGDGSYQYQALVAGAAVGTAKTEAAAQALAEQRIDELSKSKQRTDVRQFASTGKLVGAPPGKATVADRDALVARLYQDMLSPNAVFEESHLWYEKSGDTIRALAGRDTTLMEAVVRLFALYSQSNSVSGNVTAVVKSLVELARFPTAYAGRFPNTTADVIPQILIAEEFDKRLPGINDKILSFYQNLHDATFQQEAYSQESTQDRWMMRLMGYPHAEDNNGEVAGSTGFSPTQYAYARDVTLRVADAYNAAHPGERLLPRQVQAALWSWIKNEQAEQEWRDARGETELAIKALQKLKPGVPVKAGKGKTKTAAEALKALTTKLKTLGDTFEPKNMNFADVIDRSTAAVTWEVAPGKTTGMPLPEDVPAAVRRAYTRAMLSLIVDEQGNDSLLEILGGGTALYRSLMETGAFEKKVNPNVVTAIVLAGGKANLDTTLADTYAAALAILFKQDAYAWHRADPTLTGKEASVGLSISFPDTQVTDAFEERFFAHLVEGVDENIGYSRLHHGDDVVFRLINFRDADSGKPFGLTDKEFEARIEDALKKFDARSSIVKFRAQSEYVTNNWEVNKNGEGYQSRVGEAYRSRVQDWLDRLQPAVEEVHAGFAREHGWPAPAPRLAKSAVRSSGGGNERTGSWSKRAPQPAAVEVDAWHYGQERVPALSGRMYGRGIKGEEAGRLAVAADPRIKRRVYFYIDRNTGQAPNKEGGLGPHKYEVALGNMFDPRVGDPRIAAPVDPNLWESSILDAGYDGYINRNKGMAVVLDADVPATYVGVDYAGPKVAAPAPVAPSLLKQPLMSAEIGPVTAAIAGIPGARVRMGTLEVAPASVQQVNAALSSAGLGVQMSKQRDAAERFNTEQVEKNSVPNWKGREKLVQMPLDQFLALSEDGTDETKAKRVAGIMERGEQFETLPYMIVENDGRVTGHEGRHRARWLLANGYTTMPVVLKSANIRWSEQADPNRFDYIEDKDWPKTLRAQKGAPDARYTAPFPVAREDAMRPYPSEPSVSKSTARTDTPAFQRWFGDSVVREKGRMAGEDGPPAVMFHSTIYDFDQFNEFDTLGQHFGTDRAAEERLNDLGTRREAKDRLPGSRIPLGANVMPVYLRIEKPLRMKDVGNWMDSVSVAAQLRLDRSPLSKNARQQIHELLSDVEEEQTQFENSELPDDYFSDEDGNPIPAPDWASPWTASAENANALTEIRSILELDGFDGIVYTNQVEHAGTDSYIAFRSEQVKSAIGNNGQYADVADITKSAPRWGGFYSELAKQVDALPTNSSAATGWKQAIKGLTQKGVKVDEIEWSGVNEWLDLQPAGEKVTKQQVLDYLAQNGPTVKETVKGSFDMLAEDLEWATLNVLAVPDPMPVTSNFTDVAPDRIFEAELDGGRFARHEWDSVDVGDEDGALFAPHTVVEYFPDSETPWLVYSGPPERMNEQIGRFLEGRFLRTRKGVTRFGKYTVTGGKDYRELLIQLPTKVDADGLPAGYQMLDEGDGRWRFKGPSQTSRVFSSREAALSAALKDVEQERENGVGIRGEFSYPNHWEEKNVVAHVRFKERADTGGARVLFIEEGQSDWAQQGGEEGFVNPATKEKREAQYERMRDAEQRVEEIEEAFSKAYGLGEKQAELELAFAEAKAEETAARREWDEFSGSVGSIPLAPFVAKREFAVFKDGVEVKAAKDGRTQRYGTMEEAQAAAKRLDGEARDLGHGENTSAWVSLMFKRMIGWAVENGFDKIAWATGVQSAEHYKLEKHISKLEWIENEGRLFGYDPKTDQMTIAEYEVTRDKLPKYVGKELAERLVEQKKNNIGVRTLEGDGLVVGGEGMKTFYDSVLPNIANEVLRKLKAETKVGVIEVVPDRPVTSLSVVEQELGGRETFFFILNDQSGEVLDHFATREKAEAELKRRQRSMSAKTVGPQLGFEITPQLKAAAERGLPLFSKQRAQTSAPEFKRWFAGSKVVDANGEPLVVYHGTAADFAEFQPTGGELGRGIYFSPSADTASMFAARAKGEAEAVIPVYLRINNPLVANDREVARATGPTKLQQQGYDGIIYTSPTGEVQYVAFRPEQIKSAIGNEGTFDPKDARITKSADRSQYLGALTPAQEAALQQAGAIVQPKTWQERWTTYKTGLGQRAIQGIFDQFDPIKHLDQEAYMQARMSRGSDGTLEATLLYGRPKLVDGVPNVDVNDRGFAKVLADLGADTDRFFWWVAAKRAQRLKAEGRENLLTDQDISALLTLNEPVAADAATADRPARFSRALAELNEFNEAILRIALESDLIDKDGYNLFKDQPYVPFFRVMVDEGGIRGPGFGGGLTSQYMSKKLKGGSEALNQDLLANVMLNWSHVLSASAKNRAAVATMGAAMQVGAVLQVPASTPKSVRIRVEGKEQHFLVHDPYLLEAISALEYATPRWFKPFSTVKRWLTIGVTASPSFKIRNLIRDSVQAIATGQLKPNPISNVAQGFKASAKNTQTYASMLASGGMIRFGSLVEGDRAHHVQRMIDKAGRAGHLLDEGGWKKLQGQMVTLIEAYNELGDRSENVNRNALYEQLRAKGVSHLEAAFMARDLMDFAMGGTWPVVRFLTQSVPFLNARLQGLYKLGRSAKDDPARVGYTVGAVALASLALLLMYGDDEDWKKREDWDRDTYWWFKIGDVAYRIPKPFEIGAIGTIAERTWELMFDKEMSGKRYGRRTLDIITEQFAMNPVPQLVKPMIDLYANRDSFTGRQIESMGMERRRPEDRARASTSTIALALGQLGLPNPAQLANARYEALSPVQIDHLVRGYFGWLGTAVTSGLDYGLRPLSDRGARPEMRLKDVFLAGSFVETLPANSSRYVTEMYEQARQAQQFWASYRDAVKFGNTARAAELMAENREQLVKARRLSAFTDAGGQLNEQVRRIEASRSLSPETKRKMIDTLEQRRNQLAMRAVAP
jgi:hypothetical protein